MNTNLNKKSIIIKTISTGFLLLIFSMFIFYILANKSFQSYKTSMDRVFTIEKAMVFEFFPTKLSQLLIDGKSKKEIENMLYQSNFGVIHLTVTDCKHAKDDCTEQSIVATQAKDLDSKDLKGETWFLLRDPAPIYAEKKIENYKTGVETSLPHHNTGNIIGRAYITQTKDFKNRNLFNTINFSINRIKQGRYGNDPYHYLYYFVLCLGVWVFFTLFFLVIYYMQDKNKKELEYYNQSIRDMKSENDLLNKEHNRLDIENKNLKLTNQSLKAEQDRLILENQDIAEKYRYIANYATANNLTLQNELIAPMNNQIQILNAIISGLQNRVALDIRDFLHDIRKTPWLKYVSDTEDFKTKLFTKVELDKLGKFADDLDNSKKSMAWLTSNIQHLTELSLESVNVVECIADFKNNLPPTILKSDRNNVINFNGLDKMGLFVSANFYHIQAIMKNAIYNSTAQFEKIRSKKEYRRNPNVFQGVIDVDCGVFDDDFIYISIADNGGGISNEFMEKIYESFDKVNPNSEAIRGNGSILVTSFLAMYGGKAIKANTEQGFEVKFLFKKSER